MRDLFCPFRFDVQRHARTETATCGFLQQICRTDDAGVCTVDRSACEACCAEFPSMAARLNTVMPSLVLNVCESLGASEQTPPHLQRLREWSLSALSADDAVALRSRVHACDVIVSTDAPAESVVRAIESLLQQERVVPVVHVIDDGTLPQVCDRYASHPQVRVHADSQREGLYPVLHRLLPTLDSQFVAIQGSGTRSRPFRLAHALCQLDLEGAEVYGAAVETPGGIVESTEPDSVRQRPGLLPDTLVMRRATLIDLRGVATTSRDYAAELLLRIAKSGRAVVTDSIATVVAEEGWQCPAERFLEPESVPRGFAMESVACDVVLPFRGQLDFVSAAAESALRQNGAETIVHLIDDETPEDTTSFLNRWQGHPRVRRYRNRRNLGQFGSFNAVVPYLETEFVAVQDGDDISLPDRIHHSCNQLRLSGADLFGARTRLFGDPHYVDRLTQDTEDGVYYRTSAYPAGRRLSYYLENPTLVVRVETFRRLGGFADFGGALRNRTGVDTEFMIRAYCAGAAIAVSRDVVLRYRCHGSSATQHPESGWGSAPRSEAEAEYKRRAALFLSSPFNPADFGALKRHRNVIDRLP